MESKYLWIAAIIVILLVLIYMYITGVEYLSMPYYLDQMSMSYSDPALFNYTGNQRDVAGMSNRDYYLENQMNASTNVGPQYFANDSQFTDKTNYMDMPIKNRPLKHASTSASQILSEINSNNMEEMLYDDLNQMGHF